MWLALDIEVKADPPPPFIYWAPKGSTVINHANPGIWIAKDGADTVALYYGDACGASHHQSFVGEPISALPRLRAPGGVRTFCSSCAHRDDLRVDRLNVEFNAASEAIEKIACY